MKTFIISNQTTIEVFADSYSEAYDKCPGIDPLYIEGQYNVIGNDIEVVEIIDDDETDEK